MKSIISTTYDDQYLFFLPITTWLWNKLNIDVICFMPVPEGTSEISKLKKVVEHFPEPRNYIDFFKSPEHKKATYAQCSRLYGACLDLPDDEVLITSDCDMALFKIPPYVDSITIFGSDLVPEGQFPICYASGTVKEWRRLMNLNYGAMSAHPHEGAGLRVKTYQVCLDELLGLVEAEHFRGNYWGKDQETIFNKSKDYPYIIKIPRAREGTQFASNRIDRDDAYFMDRLTPDIVDYHFHRPGYHHIEKIISVIQYFYPNDNLTWIQNYRDEYVKLL